MAITLIRLDVAIAVRVHFTVISIWKMVINHGRFWGSRLSDNPFMAFGFCRVLDGRFLHRNEIEAFTIFASWIFYRVDIQLLRSYIKKWVWSMECLCTGKLFWYGVCRKTSTQRPWSMARFPKMISWFLVEIQVISQLCPANSGEFAHPNGWHHQLSIVNYQ